MKRSKSGQLFPLIEPIHGGASSTNESVPSTGSRPIEGISAAESTQQNASPSKSCPTSQPKKRFWRESCSSQLGTIIEASARVTVLDASTI